MSQSAAFILKINQWVFFVLFLLIFALQNSVFLIELNYLLNFNEITLIKSTKEFYKSNLFHIFYPTLVLDRFNLSNLLNHHLWFQ